MDEITIGDAMLNWFRGLFVRHEWIEVTDHLHECGVCGRFRAPDQEIDFLTPGAWHVVKQGDLALHFSKTKAVLPHNTLSDERLTGDPCVSPAASAQIQ